MRLKICGGLIIFVWCFLFALVCVGQTVGVSGRYEGAADVQPFGKLVLKGDIREKDGKLSGVINTPFGDAKIVEGNFKDGNVTLKLDSGDDDILLNGKLNADGKISGSIKSLSVNGTFELKRVGDASPVADTSVIISQSKEKWREDVRFLAAEIPKRHKNAFHTVRREQFEKAAAELDAKIPSLSDSEIIIGMLRLTAMIGDGHTRLAWAAQFPRVPIQFSWFGKELRVWRVGKEFSQANAARLVKVDGVSVEEILRRSRDYIPQGESEGSSLAANASYLRFPVYLHAIGVAKNKDKATYEFVGADDKSFTLEIQAVPLGTKSNGLLHTKPRRFIFSD